jgi:hypothetical protein
LLSPSLLICSTMMMEATTAMTSGTVNSKSIGVPKR